eukprot:sb/3463119/
MVFEKKSRVIATYSKRKQFVRVVRDTWKEDDILRDIRSEPPKKQLTSTHELTNFPPRPVREAQSRFAPGLSSLRVDLAQSGSLLDVVKSEPRQSYHPRQVSGKRVMRREPVPQPTPIHHLLKDSELFKSPSVFHSNFSSQLLPSPRTVECEENKENHVLLPTDFITPAPPNVTRRREVPDSPVQNTTKPPPSPMLLSPVQTKPPPSPMVLSLVQNTTRPPPMVLSPVKMESHLSPPTADPILIAPLCPPSLGISPTQQNGQDSTSPQQNVSIGQDSISPQHTAQDSRSPQHTASFGQDAISPQKNGQDSRSPQPTTLFGNDSTMAELSMDLSAMSVAEMSITSNSELPPPQETPATKIAFNRSLMLSQSVPSFNKLMTQCNKVDSLMKLVEHESSIRKIGEGTFGEVFMGERVVYKIIPVGGDTIINEVDQTTYENAFQEIVVSRQLSDLASDKVENGKAFCQLIDVVYCRGSYPTTLLKAWDEFRKPENERPDTLPEDQQYVVLLSHYSGIQLEEFCSNHNLTPDETHSILRQICCSLAAAEQKYQFEHRELQRERERERGKIGERKRIAILSAGIYERYIVLDHFIACGMLDTIPPCQVLTTDRALRH